MAEHMAFHHRAFGEYRQLAVPHERRNAHDGVVTPVWAAIALPPGTADGVGAHAQPHAKLEDARKGACRGHADDQRLQDPELRIDLHNAHELEHEVDAHDAVAIDHDHEVVIIAPPRGEVGNIAGFECGLL